MYLFEILKKIDTNNEATIDYSKLPFTHLFNQNDNNDATFEGDNKNLLEEYNYLHYYNTKLPIVQKKTRSRMSH